MAITKDDIFKAADEIQASGAKPTMELVRKRLGGGSLSTISPVLAEWKASPNKKKDFVFVEIPIEVQSVFDKLNSEMWRVLSDLTNEKILRIEAILSESLNEANSDKDLALSEIKLLEFQKEQILKDNESIQKQIGLNDIQNQKLQMLLDEAVKKNEEKQKGCLKLKERIEVLENEIRDLRVSAGQLDVLKIENKEFKENNHVLQVETNRLLVISAQFDAAKIENKELKEQIQVAQSEINRLLVISAQCDAAKIENKELKEQIQAAQIEINRLSALKEQAIQSEVKQPVRKNTKTVNET